jgi:hypothetical protein
VPRTGDRNHAIERLLREMHADRGSADGPCVGPEELAAWLDGGLAVAEAARIEAHLSSCPACQSLLGACAAAEPVSARGSSWVRAAVPFAAAAVLLVGVWLAGTRRGDTPVAENAESQMARLEDDRVAAPPPRAPQTSPQPAPPSLRRAEGRTQANEATAPATQARTLAERRDAERPEQPVVQPPAAPLPQVESQQAAAPAPTPAPTADAAGRSELARQPGLARAPAETAAPTQQRNRSALAAAARAESAPLAKADEARLAFASPDGATRWRIVGQALEASADGGTTWLPAAGSTPTEVADVTGGASPARGVAWLIGRNGLVLITADGRTFSRATAPVAAALTGVQAVDRTSAEVRAADGRSWRTADGGRSWVQGR